MISTLLFDFARVLIYPKDKSCKGKLNDLYRNLMRGKTFQFFEHFEFNEELLLYLHTIKNQYGLYMFTSGIIQNVTGVRGKLDKVFKKIYSAEELNLNKKDPQSYLFIAKDLNKNPGEILFTDDQLEFINAAENAKLVTIHFQSNKQFINELSKIMVI
ncbi:HAD hydrolase-like protein [Candidatus Gottesmanbacteria bacterium]|nr:HAD hydrolase-like protein [Candidatus Gottesmanbacteria bacterium]